VGERNGAEPAIKPEALFIHSIYFRAAVRALLEWKPYHPSATQAIPVAVLSAFTSELLLKTLVCIETVRVPKGHHLLQLFNALSASTRKRITEMWDDYAVTHAHQWAELDALIGSPVPRDLPTALSRGSKTFELARYSYEDAEDFQFYMGAFPDMLGRVAFELRPDWPGKVFESLYGAALR
jgi:hypothetical protein